jgi:hypothetical protein
MPFRPIDGRIPESQIDDAIARDTEVQSAIAASGSTNNHQHSNFPLLEKIKVDSFGQLYYESNFDPDALKAGTILALLGSLNDESGYSNVVTPLAGQSNPTQILGLDNRPALALINHQTQLSVSNIPSLLAGSAGATLYIVYSVSVLNGCENLIATNAADNWWRWGQDGNGYISVFRSTRLEMYPPNMPASGNFFVSIHSRSSDYELILNGETKGVVGGNWFGGDRFQICPPGKGCTCNLSLLLVVPFWVDKNSLFHKQKLTAIKGRFPSLPFTV